MFPLYFHIDAKIGNKKYVVVQKRCRLSSVVSTTYFMASQIMNEIFNKHLNPFVNLCHARGHKPTSVLLVSTMWYDGGGNVGSTELYEKTLELEEIISKGCQLCNTLDPVFGSV